MDIVITIPKSEYKNDDKETEIYESNPELYEQFWTLSKIPQKLKANDRVYFVKYNRIESSMKVKRIELSSKTTCEVTGRTWSGQCQLFLNDLRKENLDIQVKGFQGFRYKWWE